MQSSVSVIPQGRQDTPNSTRTKEQPIVRTGEHALLALRANTLDGGKQRLFYPHLRNPREKCRDRLSHELYTGGLGVVPQLEVLGKDECRSYRLLKKGEDK